MDENAEFTWIFKIRWEALNVAFSRSNWMGCSWIPKSDNNNSSYLSSSCYVPDIIKFNHHTSPVIYLL